MTRKLAIFTICSNNYMAMARVVIDTARKHHPDATVYLCLADKRLPDASFYPPGCPVIEAEDLGIPDFKQFAFRYDVMEFNTALKPFMLLRLLRQGHDAVLYLDPDIEVFAPLDGVREALDQGASFVLTPHLLQPAEGDSQPDDVAIMCAGIYNLGFLGVGSTPETIPILEWWGRRLLYQCVSEQSRGLFVDQKFIDLVPGFADNVSILRNPDYNVAYWNLAQRRLTHDGAGWQVDGAPIGFFHFSGFDPADLSLISKHTAALRNDAIPLAAQAIMRHYAAQVLANGFVAGRLIPYAYGHFASGAPIAASTRKLFRNQSGNFIGDPFATFETAVPPADPPPSAPTRKRWPSRSFRAFKRLLQGRRKSS